MLWHRLAVGRIEFAWTVEVSAVVRQRVNADASCRAEHEKGE